MEKTEWDAREYEMACRHFLMHVDGIGAVTAVKLVKQYGCMRRMWELEDQWILQDMQMSSRQKNSFMECRRKWDMEKEWQKLKEQGIRIVSFDERAYPFRLKKISDPPFLLYYRGRLPEEMKPCVAIIGARMCSGYGRSVAWEFAAGLAGRGIQIVSGMADGIDGIAQRSALEHGGMSYGVLGCGVDVCYPSSNRTLYQDLLAHGGILSEFLPGTKPEAGHFPMRNRIISGLADLILVIEAKERSGTRITVNMALEQGREVYAVPGRIMDELSRGCHQMIRDGAGMALNIDEIAEAATLAWERNRCLYYENGEQQELILEIRDQGANEEEKGINKEAEKEIKNREKKENGLDDNMEEKILRLLRRKEMDADEILNCLSAQEIRTENQINIPIVQGTLLKLMLTGKVVCRGGMYEIENHDIAW